MASKLQDRYPASSFSEAILELLAKVRDLQSLHDSEFIQMSAKLAEVRAERVLNFGSEGMFSEKDVDMLVGDCSSYGRQVGVPCVAQPLQQVPLPGCGFPEDGSARVASSVSTNNCCSCLSSPADASNAAPGVGQALPVDNASGTRIESIDDSKVIVPIDIVQSPAEILPQGERQFSQLNKTVISMPPNNGDERPDGGPLVTDEAAATPGKKLSRITRAIATTIPERTQTVDPVIYRVLGRTCKSDIEQQKSCIQKLVENPVVEITVAFVILANSVIMGIEVQDEFTPYTHHGIYDSLDVLFCLFFSCELFLRLKALGCKILLRGPDTAWNLLDSFLVGCGWFKIISGMVDGDSQNIQNIKAVKMLRIIRVFRVFKIFRQLATLSLMVLSSLQQLFWATILMTIIIYIVALTITDGAAKWLRNKTENFELPFAASRKTELMHFYFGGVHTSCYTLFQCAFGGVSWGEVTDVILHLNRIYFLVLCLYIAFSLIAVVNVFTGAFVEEALQQKQRQLETLIADKMAQREDFIKRIHDFFSVVDENGDGTISLMEVEEMLDDPHMFAYFDVLGFRHLDAKRIFDLFDIDGSGNIESVEFIQACENITGSARGIDLYMALAELRRLRETTRKTLAAVSTQRNE